jgi:hypothetical protein
VVVQAPLVAQPTVLPVPVALPAPGPALAAPQQVLGALAVRQGSYRRGPRQPYTLAVRQDSYSPHNSRH